MSLSKLANNRYRIALDESWKAEAADQRGDKVWYEQIPCQGEDCFISVYSLEPFILQLSTSRPKNARTVREAIKGIPGAKADFHFDGEAVIYFPPEVLPQVAELAGAKKRRRLSEAHKAKLAEVGKAHQFKGKSYGSNGAENAVVLNALP